MKQCFLRTILNKNTIRRKQHTIIKESINKHNSQQTKKKQQYRTQQKTKTKT